MSPKPKRLAAYLSPQHVKNEPPCLSQNAAINVVQEDVFATIPSAHQVVNGTRKLDSRRTGHWESFKLLVKFRKAECNTLRTDPFFVFSFAAGYLPDNLDNKMSKIIVVHPVTEIGRKEHWRVAVNANEFFWHDGKPSNTIPRREVSPTVSICYDLNENPGSLVKRHSA